MSAVVNKTITLTADWQRLSAVSLVASVAIAALHTNAASAEFRVDGGAAQEWPVGGAFPFKSIDLYRIEVRGEPGDKIVIASGPQIMMPAPSGTADAPVPILATIADDASEALIEFSEPMVWPIPDAVLFNFRKTDVLYTLAELVIVDGKLVFSNVDDAVVNVGPNVAIMNDSPIDLVGQYTGLRVEPFEYPLTVLEGK